MLLSGSFFFNIFESELFGKIFELEASFAFCSSIVFELSNLSV